MSTATTPTTNVTDAAAKLDAASDRYQKSKAHCDIARREETEALNALNDAQKAFDLAIKSVRDDAPSASDWKQKKWGSQ